MRGKLRITPFGMIPDDWDLERVGAMGHVQVGRARSPGTDRGPNMVPYLRVANVLDGCIDYSDVYSMHFSAAERRKYILRKGDILLNEGQSTELVGRSAIFKGPEETYCFQNSLVRFRCGPRVMPNFARAVFKRWLDIGHFTTIVKQTTSMAHLGGERFAKLEFPVPPLAEQKRITDILGALDEAIRKTEEVIAKLKQGRQGLLHDLLTRGIDEHGAVRDDVGRFPACWSPRPLGQAGRWVSGGTPARTHRSYWGGVVPWVSPKDMKRMMLAETAESLTPDGVEAGSRVVPAGSVMIVVRGMILAHTFPVCLTLREMAFNQDVKAIVAAPDVDGTYLAFWLVANADRMLALVTEATHGTKRIETMDLKQQVVGLPTLKEQRRIVAVLQAHDRRVELETALLRKLMAIKTGVAEDLLTGRTRAAEVTAESAA